VFRPGRRAVGGRSRARTRPARRGVAVGALQDAEDVVGAGAAGEAQGLRRPPSAPRRAGPILEATARFTRRRRPAGWRRPPGVRGDRGGGEAQPRRAWELLRKTGCRDGGDEAASSAGPRPCPAAGPAAQPRSGGKLRPVLGSAPVLQPDLPPRTGADGGVAEAGETARSRRPRGRVGGTGEPGAGPGARLQGGEAGGEALASPVHRPLDQQIQPPLTGARVGALAGSRQS